MGLAACLVPPRLVNLQRLAVTLCMIIRGPLQDGPSCQTSVGKSAPLPTTNTRLYHSLVDCALPFHHTTHCLMNHLLDTKCKLLSISRLVRPGCALAILRPSRLSFPFLLFTFFPPPCFLFYLVLSNQAPLFCLSLPAGICAKPPGRTDIVQGAPTQLRP